METPNEKYRVAYPQVVILIIVPSVKRRKRRQTRFNILTYATDAKALSASPRGCSPGVGAVLAGETRAHSHDCVLRRAHVWLDLEQHQEH